MKLVSHDVYLFTVKVSCLRSVSRFHRIQSQHSNIRMTPLCDVMKGAVTQSLRSNKWENVVKHFPTSLGSPQHALTLLLYNDTHCDHSASDKRTKENIQKTAGRVSLAHSPVAMTTRPDRNLEN